MGDVSQGPGVNTDQEIARRVHAARAYARLTQEEVAAHLGMSTVTYKRRERGDSPFTLSELERVSEICRWPMPLLTTPLERLVDRDAFGPSAEQKRLSDVVDRLADLEWRMRRALKR